MTNPFYRNIPFIKEQAGAYLKKLGYDLLGFEGLDADLIFGGNLWVQAVRPDRPELIFTILLRKQGSELKWLNDRILNSEASGVRVTKALE